MFEQKFSDRYKNIRNCNDFIYQLQEATALSDSEKKLLLAESRFLRAMHYFTLVKRYGGVPLIDEPQQYDPNNLEALMVPRNKEVEIYDFIVKECQEAAQDLPETREAEAKYRANRYVALSLCSRAALYAGSIARPRNGQQEGLVGIPLPKPIAFSKHLTRHLKQSLLLANMPCITTSLTTKHRTLVICS
ncbi:MAG: RagB/SusD family nutrient uptake outer membrane protein [Parabacteroides merdae]